MRVGDQCRGRTCRVFMPSDREIVGISSVIVRDKCVNRVISTGGIISLCVMFFFIMFYYVIKFIV